MLYSNSVWMHIRKAKHTPNSTVSVFFKAPCTLDLNPSEPAKWSKSAQIYAVWTRNKDFLTEKFDLCRMCTSCVVYGSVHESCAEGFLLPYSVNFCWPYIPGSVNEKHPKYHIFSAISVPVCRTRPTMIHVSISQLYTKLRSIHKKGRFHDTPVQLVQNVHRFASCALGHHVTILGLMSIQQESEEYGEQNVFRVICVSLQ